MKIKDKIALERYKQKLEFARSAGSHFAFETKEQRRAAIEECKKDPRKMVERYFPHYADAPCADFQIEWARKVEKNPNFKGFCQWGRALAKSVWNDIFIPFWLWLRGEPIYLVIIGNSEDRAKQLLEDIRAEFEANPRILADFGEQKQIGTWEEGFFITKGGFIGQALGMGQNVRGLRIKNKRPTHIVGDDLEDKDINKNPKRQKAVADWVDRDLIPTMDGKYKRFIQANNRFAPVMIQTILQEAHPKWFVHQVNAFDPVTYEPTWKGKYDNNYFYDLVNGDDGIGSLAANAEYNNTPHVEGTIFKDEQFQWVDLPRIDHFEIIIGRWDVAYAGNSTSDYNAIPVQGLKGRDFYLIDGFCKQCKMRDAVLWMCEFQKSLPASVQIFWYYEAQFWNDELQRVLDEVQKETGVYLGIVKKDSSKVHKYLRMLGLQPYFQNSRIYFNKKIKAKNDIQIGLAQLKGIEPGYKTHDDWPDAMKEGISDLELYVGAGGKTASYRTGKMRGVNRW
ncbi:hypothetical protein [Elizabethkingia anophelis]|uniref:hypothetical protein n=1 Tax=Elizabethkingia anophelis TaxID=1117645 RepID=UPI00293CBCDF|nr:hypothetical protein [Elizabethkingia anophelis]MDV3675123.1 hypothetical protein [Elizabethkingia anophelis]MDV3682199.1 hypothetical protein [Elizabethkingia anophelis]MDV3701855.1 hypothetical protein [Elizabethkingia anophelis]MDV3761161.1 hypothetical protein [Elizabethkingia anophelis]